MPLDADEETNVKKNNRLLVLVKYYDLAIESLVSLLILLALFSVSYGILSRNISFLPFFIWTEELSRYSMIVMVFVVSGLSIRKGIHLGLDILLEKVSSFWNKLLTVFMNLIIIVFLAYLAFVFFDYAPKAIQVSPALKLPRMILYTVMGVGLVLMILELIALSIKKMKGEVE